MMASSRIHEDAFHFVVILYTLSCIHEVWNSTSMKQSTLHRFATIPEVCFSFFIVIVQSLTPAESNQFIICHNPCNIEKHRNYHARSHPMDMMENVDLSYCISIHKSQGAEFATVIITKKSCIDCTLS
jgi:hypothetical protein